MRFNHFIFCIVILVSSFFISNAAQKQSHNHAITQHERIVSSYKTFWEWDAACNKLPQHQKYEDSPYVTNLTWPVLQQELVTFFNNISKQLLYRRHWLRGFSPSQSFFDVSTDIFSPYVQRLLVFSGTKIAIHGDFHGDVHSINNFIKTWTKAGFLDKNDPFKIVDPRFTILFLGDYTDRGWYGAEVIYTLLRLKNENPDQVFMVRGNHESASLNARYGFEDELQHKFPGARYDLIYRLYNFLPLAIFLGCVTSKQIDYIQCCHGGIELGFDPRELMRAKSMVQFQRIDQLMQAYGFDVLAKACGINPLYNCGINKYDFGNNMEIDTGNGFMWSDFIVDPSIIMAPSSRGQGIYRYGQKATQALLHHWSSGIFNIRAIFRAHQHSSRLHKPMMKRILNLDNMGHPQDAGIGKLWIENKPIHKRYAGKLDGVQAVTFSVSPHTSFNLPYDAFGLLIPNGRYEDWHLYAYRIDR